jgi:hypothetical protein
MESALYQQNGKQHPTKTVDGSTNLPMLAVKHSADDAIIEVNNAIAMRDYKLAMAVFFKDWRAEAIQANLAIIQKITEQHNTIVTQLDRRALNAQLQERAANERYESLLDKTVKTHKHVQFLEEQAKLLIQEKEKKVASLPNLTKKVTKSKKLDKLLQQRNY